MVPLINSETLLYALGVAFAVGTLAYFARDVVFGLSITVTAALLFVTFFAFLILGLTLDRGSLDGVALAIAGIAYVVGLGYVVTRYQPSETGVFLLLAASTVLFVGLGYALQEGRLAIDRPTAKRLLLAIAVVSVLLVGADSVGERETTVDLDDAAVLNGTTQPSDDPIVYGEQRIGTLTVRNPTLFTRAVELPLLEGCLVGIDDRRRAGVDIGYEPESYQLADRLGRNEAVTAEIVLRFDLPANATATGQRIPIERADSCAVTRSAPTLLVVESGER